MYSSTLGYYGKLPLSAEFIRCQASGAEIDALDQWIREGMFHAKSTLGPSWSMEFMQGDQWTFLYLPPDRSRFLVGLLKPSQDKAGREFPFLIYLLLERKEFHEIPWCAPMHFREFFLFIYLLLEDIRTEADLNRVQFRLQALSPVEAPETTFIETRYHAELLHRRMREYWTDVLGGFDSTQKYDLLRSLLHSRSGSDYSAAATMRLVDECVDVVVGDAGPQVTEQFRAELPELADALLLAEPLVHRDGPTNVIQPLTSVARAVLFALSAAPLPNVTMQRSLAGHLSMRPRGSST